MPAIPFLALALAMIAPRPLLYMCVMAQAVLCWPAIVERLEDPNRWSLHEIPWRAALGSESADAYLRRVVGDYPVARMVEEKTEPGDRIFCLNPTARAYSTRAMQDYWHTTKLLQLFDAMQTGYFHVPMTVASAHFPSEKLRAVRVVAGADSPSEWRVFELQIRSVDGWLDPDRQWSLNARPNRWDVTWALDRNRSTGWRTRDAVKRRMFLEADFGREETVTGVSILEAASSLPLVIDGLEGNGKWKHLADSLPMQVAPPADYRHDATSAVRRAGFRYILVIAADQGMG